MQIFGALLVYGVFILLFIALVIYIVKSIRDFLKRP